MKSIDDIGDHTLTVCSDIWATLSEEDREQIRTKFTEPGSANELKVANILLYLSNPNCLDRAWSDNNLDALDTIITIVKKNNTRDDNGNNYILYHTLNRTISVFKDEIVNRYLYFSSIFANLCSKKCSADQQAAFFYNLSLILEPEECSDHRKLVLSAKHAEKSLSAYVKLSKAGGKISLHGQMNDAALLMAQRIHRCVDERFTDPRNIRQDIVRARKALTKILRGAETDRHTIIHMTYLGLFWLHSYFSLPFFRKAHSVLYWKAALKAAIENEYYDLAHFISKMVERNRFMVWENPVSEDLLLEVSSILDANYAASKIHSSVAAYHLAKKDTKTKEERINILRSFVSNYNPSSDDIQRYFSVKQISNISSDLISMRLSEKRYCTTIAAELLEKAEDVAKHQAQNVMKKLRKSNFKTILQAYINENKPFGLLLRNHMVEDHVIFQTRRRDYHFGDCLIREHAGAASFQQLGGLKKLHDVERLLTEYNFISIANLESLWIALNTPTEDILYTDDDSWRRIAFSLIGEANAIVMVIPDDYDFSHYTGVLEEREQIAYMKKSEKTFLLKMPQTMNIDEKRLLERMVFKDQESSGINDVYREGHKGTPIFSSEDLTKLFPMTTEGQESEWSHCQVTHSNQTISQLREFLDDKFCAEKPI